MFGKKVKFGIEGTSEVGASLKFGKNVIGLTYGLGFNFIVEVD